MTQKTEQIALDGFHQALRENRMAIAEKLLLALEYLCEDERDRSMVYIAYGDIIDGERTK